MKKYISLICVLFILVCTVSCSKSTQKNKDGKKTTMNAEEIEKSYGEIANEFKADRPLASDASVLGEEFSDVDFTFTSVDGINAFTLHNNSFAKINANSTVFDSLNMQTEPMVFDSQFKTARGISVGNTVKEFMNKYKIDDENAIYTHVEMTSGSDAADSSGQLYNAGQEGAYFHPVNGEFKSGKLIVLFGSTDAVSYELLSADSIQNFDYVRMENADGDHVDPSKVMSSFTNYESVVSIDIIANEEGKITEFSFYKFNK